MDTKDMVFKTKEYTFLKNRLLEVEGLDEKKGQLISVLKCFENSENLFFKEIVKQTSLSDFICRPIISSLYCAGFLDKEERLSKMKFYSLNRNGKKLLQDLREEGKI